MPRVIGLLIVEFRVARRESEVGRAVASAALGCCFAVLLFFLIALAIGLVLFLSGRPIFRAEMKQLVSLLH